MMQPQWLVLIALAVLPNSPGQPPSTRSGGAAATEQAHQAAVEHLARQYRIRVYQTYRRYRAEHDRRRAAWERLESSWKAAGRPVDQQDKLIGWLSAATRASTPGSAGPLPELPRFDPAAAARSPAPGKTPGVEKPGVEKPVVEKPVVEKPVVEKPVVEKPVVEKPVVEKPVVEDLVPSNRPAAPVAEKPLPLPQPAVSLPGPSREVTVPETPPRPGGTAATGKTVEIPPLMLPPEVAPHRPVSPPAEDERPVLSGRRHSGGLPSVADTPVPSPVPTPKPPEDPTQRGLAPASTTAERRAGGEQLPDIARQPAPAVEPAETAATRPGLQLPGLPAETEPAFAPEETELPAVSIRGSVSLPPKVEGVPSEPLPPPPVAVEPPPVAVEPSPVSHPLVNLNELAAQIAGTNMALRSLEAELEERKQWRAGQLAPLVSKLKPLAARQNDLHLFLNLVSKRNRRLVGRLESPRAIISQMAAKIAGARSHAQSDQFPGNQIERNAELKLLDKLSKRLAEMVSKQ